MAWLTGKVQIFEDTRPQMIEVGNRFYYEKDGKFYCVDTDKEVTVHKVDIKEKVLNKIRQKQGVK